MICLVLGLFCVAQVSAATTDNFDPPNTAVTANQGNTAPGPVVTGGGPTGQFLRLVNDGVNSQSNHYAYNLTDTGAYSTVNAQFDFRAFGGGNPADGFSMLLLPTATYGNTGIGPGGYFAAEEPNFPGVFAVGFDVYPAGDGVNDFSLHNDAAELRNFRVNPAEVDLDANVFHRAGVQVRQMGNGSNVTMQLTRDVNGANATYTYMDEWVPGLLPYENRVQFSARTGGANMNVDLDNIDVQYSDPYTAPPTLAPASNQIAEDFDSLGTTPSAVTRAGSLPGPLVQSGGATGNFLRLTNNVNSQGNTIAFDRIADAGAFGTITADFDFSAAGGGNPADGFSFVLLPTAPYGTSGPGFTGFTAEEPNIAGALAVGFDLYPGMNEVSVHWDGAPIHQGNLPVGDIDLDSGQFHAARVAITPIGNGSNVMVQLTPDAHGTPGTAVTVFDGFVPGFTAYENRAQFTGRTGGLNVDVDLDNINVQYSGLSALPVAPSGMLFQDFDSIGATPYVLTQAGSSPGPGPVLGTDGYAMRLIHNNVNGNANAMGFDRAPDGGVSESAILTFDFRAEGGPSPADGFSMMMLPTNNYGKAGASPTAGEEPNLANTFAVGFDFHPGENEVSLHWNGGLVQDFDIAPGVIDLDSGDFHQAEVIMRQVAGGSNVTVNLIPDVHGTPGTPVNVVTDRFIAGMLPYDYRAGFAGRTGGLNMSVELDNIISSQLAGAAGPGTAQNFEGGGGTAYEGFYFNGGSPAALMTEPGNTFLRMLHSQNGTENAVAFERTTEGSSQQVDANFDIRLSGNLGADGGSFVLLNTGVYGAEGGIPNIVGWEEPNFSNTFAVGIDIHPGTSEVSLHWNGAQVANLNTVTAFGADMRGAGWLAGDLSISYDAAGAYVTLVETNNGLPLYTNHFIPGMQPYESRVVLGARTGGLNTTFDFDNINVAYTPGVDMIWTNPAVGNYVDGPNWDAGRSPSGADNPFIPIGQANSTNLTLNGSGVLTVNGGTLNDNGNVFLGTFAGGNGRIVQTSGTVGIANRLHLANNAAATGTYDLSDGQLNVGNYLVVGASGTGTFTQNGGTVNHTAAWVILGDQNGSEGTYNLNDGTLNANAFAITFGNPGAEGTLNMTGGALNSAGWFRMGQAANAVTTANQSGGTVTVASRFEMSDNATAVATYNLSGDGVLNVNSDYFIVGRQGLGTFTQSGTSVVNANLSQRLLIGDFGTADGSSYTMHGGTLNVNGGRQIVVGLNGDGTFTQTGGTVNASGRLHVAGGGASNSSYVLQDGIVNVGQHLVIGDNGTGLFEQSGGTVNVANNMGLYIGDQSSSTGTYRISGGALNVGAIRRGGHAGNTSTLHVQGAAATINTVNEYNVNDANATIIAEIANAGISTVNVGTNATVGGSVDVDLYGGVAFTESKTFDLIAAAGSVSGSVTQIDPEAGIDWEVTTTSNTLQAAMTGPGQATITPGYGGALTHVSVNGGAGAAEDYITVNGIRAAEPLYVLMAVEDDGGQLTDTELDALAGYIASGGQPVTVIADDPFFSALLGNTIYDLAFNYQPAGIGSGYFAWDLTDYDAANDGVSGLVVTDLAVGVPEPSTLALAVLAMLGLVAVARRRRK